MIPLTLLINPIASLLDKLIPDKDARAKAQELLLTQQLDADLEMIKMAAQADIGQMNVNAEEAKHANVFVAGWRPFIGWVCGVGLAYHFILQPIAAFVLANSNQYGAVVLPTFDMNSLMTLLMGMLGLGSMRTFEKVKGVARQGAPKKEK